MENVHERVDRESAGREIASDWFTGAMMAVFGVIGATMAAGARDDEILVFGWSLAAFSLMFIGGLMRHRFRKQSPVLASASVPASVKVLTHG